MLPLVSSLEDGRRLPLPHGVDREEARHEPTVPVRLRPELFQERGRHAAQEGQARVWLGDELLLPRSIDELVPYLGAVVQIRERRSQRRELSRPRLLEEVAELVIKNDLGLAG